MPDRHDRHTPCIASNNRVKTAQIHYRMRDTRGFVAIRDAHYRTPSNRPTRPDITPPRSRILKRTYVYRRAICVSPKVFRLPSARRSLSNRATQTQTALVSDIGRISARSVTPRKKKIHPFSRRENARWPIILSDFIRRRDYPPALGSRGGRVILQIKIRTRYDRGPNADRFPLLSRDVLPDSPGDRCVFSKGDVTR